ncbi:MAG: putative quinol monooxygenase [Marmoricola sp.]
MSEELQVVALIPTKPESREAIVAGLAELVAATRAEEGCISYTAYESSTQPGVFVTVETWRNQADLDAHMQTPHIAKAFDVLGPSLAGEVAIHPLQPL